MQKLLTTVTLALGASASTLERSVNNWARVMQNPDCPNGPVVCGGTTCDEDQACRNNRCEDRQAYQSTRPCPPGQSLDPFEFYECIPDADYEAMFCASGHGPAPQCEPRNYPLEPPVAGMRPGKDKPRVYLAQDINYPPYAQLDSPPDGDLTLGGFGIELAKGIEAMAPDEIEFVFAETRWDNCWGSSEIGQGLVSGWYSGCMTYTSTQGVRQRYLEFSHAIQQQNKPAGILTRLDASGNPVLSPQSDLSGVRIADVNGWAPTADTLQLLSNKCTGERFSDFMLIIPEDGNDAALR